MLAAVGQQLPKPIVRITRPSQAYATSDKNMLKVTVEVEGRGDGPLGLVGNLDLYVNGKFKKRLKSKPARVSRRTYKLGLKPYGTDSFIRIQARAMPVRFPARRTGISNTVTVYHMQPKNLYCFASCFPNPCQNGGTCYPPINAFRRYMCSCKPGYFGPTCADFIEKQESQGTQQQGGCQQQDWPHSFAERPLLAKWGLSYQSGDHEISSIDVAPFASETSFCYYGDQNYPFSYHATGVEVPLGTNWAVVEDSGERGCAQDPADDHNPRPLRTPIIQSFQFSFDGPYGTSFPLFDFTARIEEDESAGKNVKACLKNHRNDLDSDPFTHLMVVAWVPDEYVAFKGSTGKQISDPAPDPNPSAADIYVPPGSTPVISGLAFWFEDLQPHEIGYIEANVDLTPDEDGIVRAHVSFGGGSHKTQYYWILDYVCLQKELQVNLDMTRS